MKFVVEENILWRRTYNIKSERIWREKKNDKWILVNIYVYKVASNDVYFWTYNLNGNLFHFWIIFYMEIWQILFVKMKLLSIKFRIALFHIYIVESLDESKVSVVNFDSSSSSHHHLKHMKIIVTHLHGIDILKFHFINLPWLCRSYPSVFV